jgi:hypothetical protein
MYGIDIVGFNTHLWYNNWFLIHIYGIIAGFNYNVKHTWYSLSTNVWFEQSMTFFSFSTLACCLCITISLYIVGV